MSALAMKNLMILTMILGLASCQNSEEFFAKENLENVEGVKNPDGEAGDDGRDIIVDDNSTGGSQSSGSATNGSSTGSSSTSGSSTGGSNTTGSTTAGSVTGSSTGGSNTTGSTTSGSVTGSSTGGSNTTGSTTSGSVTGSSTSGSSTTGSTTSGSVTGSSTGGSSTTGSTTSGSVTGSSTGGSNTTGSTTSGSVTGSSTGGSSTTGSTTSGSVTGSSTGGSSTTGSTTSGSTTGGSSTGGSTNGNANGGSTGGKKACDEGPEIRNISEISPKSIKVQFHGVNINSIRYDISNSSGFVVRTGVITPKSHTETLYFDALSEGKYTLKYDAIHCVGSSTKDFEIEEGEICKDGPEACDLDPVVSKAGVVTILLTLGDLLNNKVVITEESARLLAQNSIKFASPVEQPKILVIKDKITHGESEYDTEYIAKVLLSNYNKVDMKIEPAAGIKAKDLEGYDLVWFNNPGHPMSNVNTMKTLMAFKGGVVLSGDDLTQGVNFSMEAFTGLKFEHNGESMVCNGKLFMYDNNQVGGKRYQVEVASQFLSGVADKLRFFEYGNDIDLSHLSQLSSKYEVLAYASPAKDTCGGKRPVIVRYEK